MVENMGMVSVDILIAGQPIKNDYIVLSATVSSAINEIPSATFILQLSPSRYEGETFAPSETEEFLPGTKVDIKAGYNGKTDILFTGIIVRHGIKATGTTGAQLLIHCQDEAVKLTLGKRIRAFKEQKDSAILGDIIGESGLEKEIAATAYTHPQLLQANTTDWDFIVTRGEANGLLTYAKDGKVYCQSPQVSGAAKLVLTYGIDVLDFNADIDAGYQFPVTKASGWDFSTGAFIAGTSTEPTINKQGNLKGKDLAKVLGVGGASLPYTSPLEQAELKGLANGLLLRSRLAMLRGRVSFFGNASPKLNSLIDLKSFGARFDGSALISSIHHHIADGQWLTETGFGLSPTLFHEKHPQPNGNQGLLPAISGLQNGEVKQLTEDPSEERRILVHIPVLGTDVWARQATLYATQAAGSFFLPEIGDEVIVGFLNDDPRFAIILGSVHSSRHTPPYAAEAENHLKAMVTRSKLELMFDDEKKELTLATPAGNTITLSDDDASVAVKDQNGNEITMTSAGITLKSTKDITLDAGRSLRLKAGQNIELKATGGDVSLNGVNVVGKAKVSLNMTGSAKAELSAGGQTVVKGAMVLIN